MRREVDFIIFLGNGHSEVIIVVINKLLRLLQAIQIDDGIGPEVGFRIMLQLLLLEDRIRWGFGLSDISVEDGRAWL